MITLTMSWSKSFSWMSEPEALSILPRCLFSDMAAITAGGCGRWVAGRRVTERRECRWEKLIRDESGLYMFLPGGGELQIELARMQATVLDQCAEFIVTG